MSDGKGDWQLSFPHKRLPMHSSSESQSPWCRSHWLDDVQHVYLSSLMALQILAEKVFTVYYYFALTVRLNSFNPKEPSLKGFIGTWYL